MTSADSQKQHIPRASQTDYTDPVAICAYQRQLCQYVGANGGFTAINTVNTAVRAAVIEGRVWLTRVGEAIDGLLHTPLTAVEAPSALTLGDIPELLNSYDIMHRIVTGEPCFSYLRQIRLRTADRHAHGDHSITQAAVVLMLLHEAQLDIRSMPRRYLDYSTRIMAGWVEQLRDTGHLSGVSQRDTYDILRYLLTHDLYPYLGSNNLRPTWIQAHILSEHCVSTLDSPTLRAYTAFTTIARRCAVI